MSRFTRPISTVLLLTVLCACVEDYPPANVGLCCVVGMAEPGDPGETPPVYDPCDDGGTGSMALNVSFEGVWTNPNAHSKVPAGAARRAENVVNPRPGIASCVAGQEALPGQYEEDDERFSSGLTYQGMLVEHTSGAAPRFYLRDTGANTLSPLGDSISPPAGVDRMPMAVAGDSLYMAASDGLKVLDGVSNTPGVVGLPTPFQPAYSVPGELPNALTIPAGGSVAYRAEFRRAGVGGRTIISVPSGRTVVTNNASPSAASGTVTITGGADNVYTSVNGILVGPIAAGFADFQTAAALAAAINKNPDLTTLVTATWTTVGSDGVVTVTADAAGESGNSIEFDAFSLGGAGDAYPSGPTLTGGSNNSTSVITKNYLPDGLQVGDDLRLYRSGVSESGVSPGDILYLVYSTFLTSSDISAKYHEWTDSTPDEMRGEGLYTNATQEGISRQNERPPMAKDMTVFDDFLVAANVQGPQRFALRLLGLPSNGDVITIGGQTFTASSTSENPTAGIFSVYDTAPTTSENIRNAAVSLALAINRKTTNTGTYAYYASGESDPPGIIAIEARNVADAAFTIVASANGERYEPQLLAAQSSQATVEENGLWFSKRGQHFAFPPLRSSSASYRFRVGNSGRPILRAIPLREALIVWVENEGVWKVKRTGAESWRVDPINTTTHLLAPQSLAVVDNQVVALTTRGVVVVDESGVEEIDLPIKNKIEEIKALGTAALPHIFGVGDDARLRYILYHPLSASDTTSTHAWVYNADNGTWTERTDAASGGFVGEEDGLLYLGSPLTPTLTRERTGTAAQLYKRPDNTAIPVRLELTVQDEGDPSAEKQFTEIRLMTENAITGDVVFNCTNDLKGTESTTGSTSTDENGEPFVLAWVPDGCQRTTRLKVDIQREVLGEAFDVVALKTVVADMYSGGMAR